MSHTLKKDELAIIISPKDYEDWDLWEGAINVDIISADSNVVPLKVLAHLMNIATMMSAFLDVAQDNDNIYDLVEEIRNHLMGIDFDRNAGQQEGNVYYLNRWTKTEGNA